MRKWTFPLLLLACSLSAYAQVGEFSLSFGKTTTKNGDLGSTSATTSTGAVQTANLVMDSNFRMSLRFTINSWRFFGHELGYGYNRGNLKFNTSPTQDLGGMPIHQYGYAFLAYATPEGSRIRPFGAGGVHFSTFYPPGSSVFSGNGINKFGVNFGGGVKVRLTSFFQGRLDIRDYMQPKPDFGLANQKGWLQLVETSVGLGVMF